MKVNYLKVIHPLREIYAKKHSIECGHELRYLKKLTEESREAFAGRIKKMTIKEYSNSPVEEGEKSVIDYFINGLEGYLKKIIETHKTLTIRKEKNE